MSHYLIPAFWGGIIKIHLLSDVHLEFEHFIPAVVDADVTVLAGDIAPKMAGLKWTLRHFPGRVLYVCGNHEFYGTELDRNFENLQSLAKSETGDRVRVLNRQAVTIDWIRFLCGTAWTDFNLYGNQPMASLQAQGRMSDYRYIRLANDGYRKLHPSDTSNESEVFKGWLQHELEKPHAGKTVVVTHHAPSARSLVVNDNITGPCYANRWESLTKGSRSLGAWAYTQGK